MVFRGELTAAIAAAAQAPARAGELARRLLQDPTYQTELPAGPPPLDLAPPPVGGLDVWPLLRLLAYVALAVAAALAIFWLLRRFLGRDDDVAAPDDAAPAPLRVEMAGPQRLAAAGKYAEAIHALLLETLAAVSRAGQLPPSYTSREILERVRLPARARDALSGLVIAVEVSRFGGLPAGEADYRICLDRFHAFLESYGRPAQGAAA